MQHALRAYTPAEEKAIKAVADSFRENPAFDTYEVLTSLGTGEALISTLDEKGIPGIVKKCNVLPPQSMMGPISDEEKKQEILINNLYLRYQNEEDRDSAYEFFQRMTKEAEVQAAQEAEAAEAAKIQEIEAKKRQKEEALAEKKRIKEEEKAMKEYNAAKKRVASSAASTIGREVGNLIGKSVGGSFGKKLGGNVGASLARNILGTFLK